MAAWTRPTPRSRTPGPAPRPSGSASGWAAQPRRLRRTWQPQYARPSKNPAYSWPSPDTESVVGDTTGDDWEADRVALETRELGFADFLHRRGLVLRADLLGAWAHWITPEFEPRRYDTRFFVAALPAGQVTRDVTSESDQVAWLRPADAVRAVEAGEMLMLPPTYLCCRDLTPYDVVADALAASAEREIRPILPTVRVQNDQAYLETT